MLSKYVNFPIKYNTNFIGTPLMKLNTEEKSWTGGRSNPEIVEECNINFNTFDKLIDRMLAWKPHSEAGRKSSPLTFEELYFVIDCLRDELIKYSALLEVQAPIMICGDTHGQYPDLIRMLYYCQMPPERRYLFLGIFAYGQKPVIICLLMKRLDYTNIWIKIKKEEKLLRIIDHLGDYVDRGPWFIETVTLMFLFRLSYPNDFFILRGNHETAIINRVYGFYDECRTKFGEKKGISLWTHFQIAFDCLPVAAIISKKIFCMHGGLSPTLVSFNQIRSLNLPFMVPNMCCLVTDLLWSDPMVGITGFVRSNRGVSYLFGEDVVNEFCRKFDLDLICRAHQVVTEGYEFFCDRKLITIFSAPNYCDEFNNSAGMLSVSESLKYKILVSKD